MPGSRMVTLTTFSNPIEAELARNRLEAEGIRAFLSGDAASNLFGGTFGITIALQVSESDAEKADQVLAELPKPGDLRRNFLADAARASGTEKDDDNTAIKAPEWASADETDDDDPEARYRAADTEVAPASRVAKEERIKAGDWEALATQREAARTEADDAEELQAGSSSDDYAARAFKAALIGLIVLPGILHVYSIYQLTCLLFADEDLSPAAMKKLYGAIAIDAVVMGTVGLLFLSMLK